MVQLSSAAGGPRIKVLVVDDSALIRQLMTEIINRQPDMTCVGAAADPFVAREMVRATNPDVLTLDIEMPRMDGLEFLEKIMRLRPMPVVMVSTLTERGADVTMRALELGAVDFIAKPKLDVVKGLREVAAEMTDKIRAASHARVRRIVSARPPAAPIVKPPLPMQPALPAGRAGTEKLILIGSSTGGTEALKELLLGLPPDAPAVLIAQHMPAGFTTSFSLRLDAICRIRVREATHGERVLPGHAYLAPGGKHMRLARTGANYVIALDEEAPINRHRPSVEALFRSAAQVAGPNAIGIMLTGMGADGALAMREMKDAGAFNIAQDEASCVVFGMPREAIAAGAVDEVLPLDRIAPRVLEVLRSRGGSGNRV
ncbi:MAG: chemotaxis response regulator protein-glutamate methylesterase [Burkholderiaceae bacterium]